MEEVGVGGCRCVANITTIKQKKQNKTILTSSNTFNLILKLALIPTIILTLYNINIIIYTLIMKSETAPLKENSELNSNVLLLRYGSLKKLCKVQTNSK